MVRMIRGTSIVGTLGMSLLAATLALAQDAPAGMPGNDATLRDTPAVNSALPPPLPASKSATDGELGEHQVTGTVTGLDPASGTLVVDVKGKDVRVLFPASALSRLEKGDEVTVTVAVHKNAASRTQ